MVGGCNQNPTLYRSLANCAQVKGRTSLLSLFYRRQVPCLFETKTVKVSHKLSVTPLLMANGQPIQFLAATMPLWHESIHEGDEARVMGGLQDMDDFVDEDIFEAFAWFLREIGVQSDAA